MVQPANKRLVTEASTLLVGKVSKGALVLNARDYGAIGDDAADDTAAIGAAITAARSFVDNHRVRTVWVYLPRGAYRTARFSVPGGVALLGDGLAATRLKNISTDGLVFITMQGSNSFVRGLLVDGQMGVQTTVGLAAVQFSRPNAVNAAPRNVAGGIVLSAPCVAGATTIAVTVSNPGGEAVHPGDIITVIDPTTTPIQYEMLRVSESYTVGSLTVPLEAPTTFAHAVTALCSVASTNVGISDCTVLGNGRDGIAFWHCIHAYARNNLIRQYQDTGIDCPAGGSRFVDIHNNHFDTQGRWGVAFDSTPASETDLGRLADCKSFNNTIVFQPGGSYVNGNTIDGVYLGNVDRCHSIGDKVDLTYGGLSGVVYAGQSTGCRVESLDVLGPPVIRAGTSGVRVTSTAALSMSVLGGHINNVSNGVDASTAKTAVIRSVDIVNVASYGINMLAVTTYVQNMIVVGCYIETNTAGVRTGGAPAAGAKATVTGSVLLGSSFAPTVFDTGWASVLTGNAP